MKHIRQYDLDREIALLERDSTDPDTPSVVLSHLSYLRDMRKLRELYRAEGLYFMAAEVDFMLSAAHEARIHLATLDARKAMRRMRMHRMVGK